MKKIFITLVAFIYLVLAPPSGAGGAFAQNITKVEYYIDTDPGYGLATNVPITAGTPINDFTFSVPMTSIADGFHRVFVRTKDINGDWSMVSNNAFLKMAIPANPTLSVSNIVKVEYYIDTDPGYGLATDVPVLAGTPIIDLNFNVPMTSVTDGFHRVFVRVKDVNGDWAMVANNAFLKMAIPANPVLNLPNISKVEYYIDTDPGYGLATDVPISAGTPINNLSINVPMTSISDGFHRVFVRTKDANNVWSMVASNTFLKMVIPANPTISTPTIVKAEYYVDTDPGYGLATNMPLTAGTPINNLTANVNISALTLGTHKIYVRTKDTNGDWSMVSNQTLTIATNAMLVGTIPSGFCKITAFNVPFTANGTFSAGNVFTAQLSNSSGSFASPTVLGTLTGTTSGTISATIPNTVAVGTGYKIRVVPSNPALTNVDEEAFSVLAVCPPPCSTIVTLQSTADDYSSGTLIKEANATTGTITATNKITSTAKVTYRAGKSITLNAGFKADNGTVFKTEFGGCN